MLAAKAGSGIRSWTVSACGSIRTARRPMCWNIGPAPADGRRRSGASPSAATVRPGRLRRRAQRRGACRPRSRPEIGRMKVADVHAPRHHAAAHEHVGPALPGQPNPCPRLGVLHLRRAGWCQAGRGEPGPPCRALPRRTARTDAVGRRTSSPRRGTGHDQGVAVRRRPDQAADLHRRTTRRDPDPGMGPD